MVSLLAEIEMWSRDKGRTQATRKMDIHPQRHPATGELRLERMDEYPPTALLTPHRAGHSNSFVLPSLTVFNIF